MINVERCDTREAWDDYVLDTDGHPLQLWGWGEVKAAHGWQIERVFVADEGEIIGAAQLLTKPLLKGFKKFVYVPRGPVTHKKHRGEVLDALATYVKSGHGALALSIEPHWLEFEPPQGWKRAKNTILLPRTVILDLAKTEDELLAAMAKKTRQYIRKSENDGIEVRQVKTPEELGQCLAIYHETAKRAGFELHDDRYYQDIYDNLGEASPVFAAFHGGSVVAFLWLAVSQHVAFELYGGVNEEGQQLRANYVLKWRAIQTMKKWEVANYDMNGLLNDGVSTFKQSFNDHDDELVGTYDKPLSMLYIFWDKLLPLAKKIIRAMKNR